MRTENNSLDHLLIAILLLTGTLASTPANAEEPLQPVPPPGPGWSLPNASPVGLEQRAMAVLERMSDYLLGLGAFSFVAEGTWDIVADTGQKIQYIGQTEILVRRSDGLWFRRNGPLAQVEGFYDGNSATIFDNHHNYYVTRPAPPTLDGLLDMLQDDLGLDLPVADLLYSNLQEGIMRHTVSGFYVGVGIVGGVRAHQLAFRGKEIDWQIWIEEGDQPLPRKMVITSIDVPGAPQFGVVLTKWSLAPSFGAGFFDFTPPKDARRIEFLPSGGAQPKSR